MGAPRLKKLKWWGQYTASLALELLPFDVNDKLRRVLLHSAMQQLNSALSRTTFWGHFWLGGGHLLGWARWGDALPGDERDVDFFFLAEDYPRFVDAVPALEQAGFKIKQFGRNNDGDVVAAQFMKWGIQFDFLKLVPKDGRLLNETLFIQPVQVAYELPDSPREWFELRGCRWLKPADHEGHLAALYGDWRNRAVTVKGRPGWHGPWRQDRDSPAIVRREPWAWTGLVGAFDGDLAEHRSAVGVEPQTRHPVPSGPS